MQCKTYIKVAQDMKSSECFALVFNNTVYFIFHPILSATYKQVSGK